MIGSFSFSVLNCYSFYFRNFSVKKTKIYYNNKQYLHSLFNIQPIEFLKYNSRKGIRESRQCASEDKEFGELLKACT